MGIGWTLLILAIYVLACARLTKIVNDDLVFDPLRVRVAGKAQHYRELVEEAERTGQTSGLDTLKAKADHWGTAVYFLGCPWCVGWWVCLAASYLPVHLIGWPWWTMFPIALAASYLVGVFAPLADTEDIQITPK